MYYPNTYSDDIMLFFPPVLMQIDNVYDEARASYVGPYKFPFKIYNVDILTNLRVLRILLNYSIDENRLLNELDRLVYAYAAILKPELYNNIQRVKADYIKREERMKLATDLSIEHNISEIENELSNVTVADSSVKKRRKSNLKDLNLSRLQLFSRR